MDPNNIWAGVATFALLVWLARCSYSAGRRGDRQRGRIAGFFMLAFSFAAMFAFLFVISWRVPSSEKDGLFGGAAGLVLGAIIANMASSAHLIGTVSRGSPGKADGSG